MNKVVNIIKNIILDILIVFLIVLICFQYVNRNKPVKIFEFYLFNVLTGSMENKLHIGDYIIVKECDEYKEGDIVTYKKDSIYVTHRIVKIDGNNVITKGDANTSEDPAFDKNDILGKFVYKSKLLNFVINNKFIIAGFIILIMILDSVFFKEERK